MLIDSVITIAVTTLLICVAHEWGDVLFVSREAFWTSAVD
jgi:hypothetical protein